jgi:hypothetical protein
MNRCLLLTGLGLLTSACAGASTDAASGTVIAGPDFPDNACDLIAGEVFLSVETYAYDIDSEGGPGRRILSFENGVLEYIPSDYVESAPYYCDGPRFEAHDESPVGGGTAVLRADVPVVWFSNQVFVPAAVARRGEIDSSLQLEERKGAASLSLDGEPVVLGNCGSDLAAIDGDSCHLRGLVDGNEEAVLVIGARVVDGLAALAMPGPAPWPGSSDFSGFRVKVGGNLSAHSCGKLDLPDGSASAWDLLRAAQAADRDLTYWVDPGTDELVAIDC